jgi:hypothetical protein
MRAVKSVRAEHAAGEHDELGVDMTSPMRRRRWRVAYVAIIAVIALVIAGVVFVATRDQAGLPLSGWTTKLSDSAPLETDPQLNGTVGGHASYAKRFANMARYTNTSQPVAGFYAPGYSAIIDPTAAPVYIISDPHAPTQKVTWMMNDGKGPEAPLDAADGLQQAFLEVPIPTGPAGQQFESYYGRALEAGGPDKQLVIYVPETGQMWEMWQFQYSPMRQRYEMGFGGYAPDVRHSPIALPHGWGARATSLPLAAGIMLQAEYKEGVFPHPLAVAIPVVKDGFIPPATRQDTILARATVGGDDRDAIPEGAWFRLPAGYPVDTTKPKLWQMVVTAARDYGIVVVDGTGGSLTFSAEGANAVGTPYSRLQTPALPNPTGPDNPYHGNSNVLNDFPWDDLVQIAYRP